MGDGRLHEYKKGSVTGASPLQLVIMLYDGALASMEAGKAAILAREREIQNRELQKAQKMIAELISCLDLHQGGEIAANLFSLYNYVLAELASANMQDDTRKVDVCIKVMGDLRATWQQLAATLAAGQDDTSLAA